MLKTLASAVTWFERSAVTHLVADGHIWPWYQRSSHGHEKTNRSWFVYKWPPCWLWPERLMERALWLAQTAQPINVRVTLAQVMGALCQNMETVCLFNVYHTQRSVSPSPNWLIITVTVGHCCPFQQWPFDSQNTSGVNSDWMGSGHQLAMHSSADSKSVKWPCLTLAGPVEMEGWARPCQTFTVCWMKGMISAGFWQFCLHKFIF